MTRYLLFLLALLTLPLLAGPFARAQLHERHKLTSGDIAAWDYFGYSAALHQDIGVIGAIGDDDNGSLSGSAYVFRRDFLANAWQEEAKLLPASGGNDDYFGSAVAAGDGLVVVGAPGATDNGPSSGAAVVFRFDMSSGTWVEEARLVPSDGDEKDRFGHTIGLSSDVAAVGAPTDDENGNHSGSAYVYRYDQGSARWIEETKLLASDGDAYDNFGQSVAVWEDVVVIGAHRDDDGYAVDSGAAYVFRRDPGSGIWTEEAKLTYTSPWPYFNFGEAVATVGDLAVIGVPGADEHGTDSGSIVVFRYDAGTGTWNREAILQPADSETGDRFGNCLSVSSDMIVAGAHRDDDQGTDSGSAYAFRRDPVSGLWLQYEKLLPSDGVGWGDFGFSVALSERTVLTGSPGNDQNGYYSGAAYIHDLADYPELDIKCNTQDQNVIVPQGSNVTLTIDVASCDFVGYPVDVWVLAKYAAFGRVWSCGYHGAPAWQPGLGRVYFTGALNDLSETVLDTPLPRGAYTAWLILEINPNSVPDMDYVHDFDAVNFLVLP